MYGRVRLALASIAALLIFSSSAFAQASITGVVRDTSGAVLPGVTVEASSPALIEKVRSVVSDGSGQYRIENLRPGDYVVTFTLPGFATVKREGIQLAGSFVASVNAELRVGALEETITVTGETPSVDVQSTLRQTVFDEELLEALPSSRAPQRVAALLPGVTTQRQDVGGIQGDGTGRGLVTVRGVSDARMNINGVSNQATSQSVTAADGAYNMAAYQEMAVDTGGSGAEYSQGGLRMNMIPRDGGNVFRGYFLASYASDSLQSDNLNDDLIARGLSAPDKIKRLWDINPAFGGPIKRDKVWFHSTMRLTGAATYASLFFNKNAGNPNAVDLRARHQPRRRLQRPHDSQRQRARHVAGDAEAQAGGQRRPVAHLRLPARPGGDHGAGSVHDELRHQLPEGVPVRRLDGAADQPAAGRFGVRAALEHDAGGRSRTFSLVARRT